jgi:hypothetical protein
MLMRNRTDCQILERTSRNIEMENACYDFTLNPVEDC